MKTKIHVKDERTCNNCGRVGFAVSRKFAEEQVKLFGEYYNSLSAKKQQENYGGHPATISDYDQCGCGNPHTNFRASRDEDCPNGCTLSPIIFEEDDANAI